MANRFKYRADHLGSLLRPPALMKARADHAASTIDADALHAAEDQAIGEAIAMQSEAGLDVVSDGEFRRRDFRSNFADAVEGMTLVESEMPWHGAEGDTVLKVFGWTATAKLTQRARLAEREVAFLKDNTKRPIKVALPSPGFLAGRAFQKGVTERFYPTLKDLTQEFVAITRKEIEALIADGVQYIQLDNPGFTFFLDERNRAKMQAAGHDPDRAFEDMLAADVATLAGLEKPDDVRIGIHLCRGNHSSYWLSEGGYDRIAERLFNELPVDRFLLEYDDERSGDFAPLRFVPKGKTVVLGLISTKTPQLETHDDVLNRVDQAAETMDSDDLAISPQCGFASVAAGGNHLSIDDERRKLQRVVECARMFWGNEM